MQRNQALIRSLLEYVEREQQSGPIRVPNLEGHTLEEVHSHVGLCVEEGYLVAQEFKYVAGGILAYHTIDRLTSEGHDALDELRKSDGGGC